MAFLRPIDGTDAIRTAFQTANQEDCHVVVAGDFNAGKSTLLNALLGRHLLTSSPVPSTGQITQVRFGRDEHVCVCPPSGRETRHSIEMLEQLTTLDLDSQAARGIERVRVTCNASILDPTLVLVDTPGSNDDIAQTLRALEALGTADAVLWVVRGDVALRQGERRLASTWLGDHPGLTVIPIVNFMNFVPPKEQGPIRERLRIWLERNYRSRVAWVTQYVGRPFFEVDAQQALQWATEGVGQPEQDFLTLRMWLQGLCSERGRRIAARSRSLRLKTKLNSAHQKNEEQLQELRRQAQGIAGGKAIREREAESQLRRFEDRAETYLAMLEELAAESLAKAGGQLIDFWLCGESAFSLRQNSNTWARYKLGEAVTEIAEAMTLACKNLAAEFTLPKRGLAVPKSSLPIQFHVALPQTGFWDDLCDLFNTTPTDEYMSKVRSHMQREWKNSAFTVITAMQRIWTKRVHQIEKKLQLSVCVQATRDFDGWSWVVKDEFVAIKASEFWIRRWATQSSKKPNRNNEKEASRSLARRIEGGEPLRQDLLEREAGKVALEWIRARHRGQVGEGGQ